MAAFTAAAATFAGTAFQMFGAMRGNAAQKRMAELEMQVEAQRKLSMERDAQRRTLEQFRQAQRARSMSLAIATSQGAAQGSGLGGAYGQISGQAGTNLLGISQNLEIGRNIFDLNAQISQQKMELADAQMFQQMGAGLTTMGGNMMQMLPAFGRVTGRTA